MRILFISAAPDLPETYLGIGVAAAGHDVLVMGTPAPLARERMEAGGVKVREFECRSRVDLAAAHSVRRVAREGSFDLIHAFTGRTIAAAVLGTIGMKIPIVAYRGTMGNVGRLDPSSWITFLNPKVHRIVCVSEAVRQDLLKVRAEPRAVVTIYKGHDPAWYASVPPVSRESLGLPEDAFVVVCTANMRPVKGVSVLIRAFHLLPEDVHAHLLLVGEVRDPALRPLAASGRHASRIHFAGFRTDAAAVTGASDLMVMPTLRREGFPKAVIEAMVRGIPAVVTAVGGMPELVKDGECGLVVPPNDERAMADAILKLYRDPDVRRRFGEAAKARIAAQFDIKTTIERTLALYGELVKS